MSVMYVSSHFWVIFRAISKRDTSIEDRLSEIIAILVFREIIDLPLLPSLLIIDLPTALLGSL